MSVICGAVAVTVAAVYCLWRARRKANDRRQSLLRQRIAYMLWVMAEQEDGPAPPRWGGYSWPAHPRTP